MAEDIRTSYRPCFDDGFRNPKSFVEKAKDLFDHFHS